MKKINSKLHLKWGLFKIGKGICAAAWTPKGLSALILPQASRERALQKLHEYLPASFHRSLEDPPITVPRNIQHQTRRGLSGKPFHLTPFDLSFLTAFQQKILRATCQIPFGQTRTYGWVAGKAGSPRGYRAAGQALNRNTLPLFIPCHRVIASGNRLGGYGGGIAWKIRLLKAEGVETTPAPEGSYRVRQL